MNREQVEIILRSAEDDVKNGHASCTISPVILQKLCRNWLANERIDTTTLDDADTSAGWRPIETAPQDGTNILIVQDDRSMDVACWADWYGEGAWVVGDEYECEPTHWMPLPAPPVAPEPHHFGFMPPGFPRNKEDGT